MARSFSSVKLISDLVANAINRRGFLSTAATTVNTSASLTKKTGLGEEMVGPAEVSWVPDPRTGFYRPEQVAEKILMDPAELRAMLLKKH